MASSACQVLSISTGSRPSPISRSEAAKRLHHQTVRGHAADHADEVRTGFVDDALDLGSDGDGKAPVVEPAADAARVLVGDTEADQNERTLGRGKPRAKFVSAAC